MIHSLRFRFLLALTLVVLVTIGAVLFFIIALLAVYLTVQGWSGIEHSPSGRVGELLSWWLSVGAQYELSKLVEASGMV